MANSAKRKSIVFSEETFFSASMFPLLYFLLYFSSFVDVFRFEKMKRLEKRGERRSRVIRLLAVGWGKEIIMEHRDDTSGTNVNRVRDCFRVRGARCTRENYGLSR